MKFCNEHCTPWCGGCKHVKISPVMIYGKPISSQLSGCKLHPDEKHTHLVQNCGYCEDFHCKAVNDTEIVEVAI